MKTENEYIQIHTWIVRTFGKATKCENKKCSYKNPKRYEWALKKGCEYCRKRENFIMLCPSCHRKYDMTKKQYNRLLNSVKQRSKKLRIKIVQLDLNGNKIKKWDSLSEASRNLNINRGNICNNCKGKTKHAGGYLFKYL